MIPEPLSLDAREVAAAMGFRLLPTPDEHRDTLAAEKESLIRGWYAFALPFLREAMRGRPR
jgi:hypothetical protein